jgi:uncharacterized protein
MAEWGDIVNVELLPFATVELEGGAAIVSPSYGTCFVCDRILYKYITNRNIDEDLALKLYQLGLCRINGEKRSIAVEDKLSIGPSFFLIDITQRCNLKCVYCYRTLGAGDIDPQVLDQILNYIYTYCTANCCSRIFIQPWGGEPLLAYDRIRQIYDFFAPLPDVFCKLSLETNGTCITSDIASGLKAMNCGVGISIDGLAATHNHNRPFAGGNPSLNSVISGIEKLIEAGYQSDDIGAILTLTQSNLEEIEVIMDFFAKSLGLTNFKMNHVMRNPHIDSDDICITPSQYAQAQIRVLDKVIALRKEGYRFSESNLNVKGRNILFQTKGNICKTRGCQGGYKMIAFDHTGHIYPCNLTDHPELNIGLIWQDLDLNEVISEAIKWHPFFTDALSAKCMHCPWRFYCRGGCHTARFYENGNFKGVDEFECHSNKMIYPYLLRCIMVEPELVSLFRGN